MSIYEKDKEQLIKDKQELLDVLDIELIKISHEEFVRRCGGSINWTKCPEHLRGSIENYFKHRVPFGNFLTAFFSNDLGMAISRADSDNSNLFNELYVFMYNELPSGCYGNKEKVRDWLDGTFALEITNNWGDKNV